VEAAAVRETATVRESEERTASSRSFKHLRRRMLTTIPCTTKRCVVRASGAVQAEREEHGDVGSLWPELLEFFT